MIRRLRRLRDKTSRQKLWTGNRFQNRLSPIAFTAIDRPKISTRAHGHPASNYTKAKSAPNHSGFDPLAKRIRTAETFVSADRTRAMVERLKQSVEGLEPPQCPDCHLEMAWYRSVLVKGSEPGTIEHFFQCSNCNRLRDIRTRSNLTRSAAAPKLSKPAHGFSCAA
jgi:hypothetical protein